MVSIVLQSSGRDRDASEAPSPYSRQSFTVAPGGRLSILITSLSIASATTMSVLSYTSQRRRLLATNKFGAE